MGQFVGDQGLEHGVRHAIGDRRVEPYAAAVFVGHSVDQAGRAPLQLDARPQGGQ
jgi:hypothetical protein